MVLETITSFFIWKNSITGKRFIISILHDGAVEYQKIDALKGKEFFKAQWENWQAYLCKMQANYEHVMPFFGFHKLIKTHLMMLILESILLLTLVVGSFRFLLSNCNKGIGDDLPFFLAILFCVMIMEIFFFAKHVYCSFHRIFLEENCIVICFTSGKIQKLPFSQIKEFNFDVLARNSYLKFQNGLKLTHLEQIAFWPILREQLKQRLTGIL